MRQFINYFIKSVCIQSKRGEYVHKTCYLAIIWVSVIRASVTTRFNGLDPPDRVVSRLDCIYQQSRVRHTQNFHSFRTVVLNIMQVIILGIGIYAQVFPWLQILIIYQQLLLLLTIYDTGIHFLFQSSGYQYVLHVTCH